MKYHKPFVYDSIQTIISVESIVEGIVLLEFDDTIFYPGGGGQPHDTGYIIIQGEQFEVLEVSKKGSQIIHKVRVYPNSKIEAGLNVQMLINKERRLNLIKAHSGEHLFMGCLQQLIPEIKVDKIALEETESSLFVTLPQNKELSYESLLKAEKMANQIIEKDKPIKIHITNRDEISKGRFPKARIKLDKIMADSIRIIEIDNFDYSACAGIHCEKTSFIGNFVITKIIQNQDNKYEIKFKVDALNHLLRQNHIILELIKEHKINESEIIDEIKRIKTENENLKKKLRNIMNSLGIKIEEEKINDIMLRYAILENFEKKQLNDKFNEIYEEFKNKQILIIFNKVDETKKQFILKMDNKIGDANNLIKELEIKGGGRDNFISGTYEDEHSTIKKIKKYFKEHLF
jgi:alanyl-tRNA synthetase